MNWTDADTRMFVKDLHYPYLDLAGYPYDPSQFGSEALVRLPLRAIPIILLGGRIVVKTTMQCEHEVKNLRSSAHCHVVWPMWMANIAEFFVRAWRKHVLWDE